VRAHRYDVCDIPIHLITRQFIEYLRLMEELDLEYAGDFLVTAATLMQIKSRMLLPQHESQNEDAMQQEEADPRKELVERLLEYQRFQEAAETLKEMGDSRANTFARIPPPPDGSPPIEEVSASLLLQDISTFDLLRALQKVLDRQSQRPTTTIRRDPFTLSERVRDVFKRVSVTAEGVNFDDLCEDCQSRLEVVITFLALLELISRKRVIVEQARHFDEIWVRAKTDAEKAEAAEQMAEFAVG
jgi:segregation and condensation protein A